MKKLRESMARTRATWWLYMTAATLPLALIFVVQVLWDACRQAYATWHWQYKYDWKSWLSAFGEKHRRTVGTPAARPSPVGGAYMRKEHLQ